MAAELPSYSLENSSVRVTVTQTAGHMTADFTLGDGRVISPYAAPLWDAADFPEQPKLLSHLRGDFFCLPFGPQAEGNPHGDTANERWNLENKEKGVLTLTQEQAMGAKVKKVISLQEGHTALYLDHQITGLHGDWSYGTHPILEFAEMQDGEARIATSEFDFGSTYPGSFANPADGEKQSLQEDAAFTSLTHVPLADGSTTDLTRYPARPGYEDLIMVSNAPATPEQPFAWSAAVFQGSLWFALKNPADFPSTLFWISNGGRPQAPWNGRHVKRLGIEDVCSHYCDSVETSRTSPLHRNGREILVTRSFNGTTTSLRHIQGVAACPQDFGLPTMIRPLDDHTIEIHSEHGHSIQTSIDWKFLLP